MLVGERQQQMKKTKSLRLPQKSTRDESKTSVVPLSFGTLKRTLIRHMTMPAPL